MKHIFFISFASMLLAFSACRDKDPIFPISTVSGSEAIIPWQECAFFADHNYTICFIGAKEERCPCNTNCLWEGSVDATLRVTSPTGIDTTITLTTNSNPVNLHNFHTVGGKTIVFVNTFQIECADYGKYEKYKVIIKIQ
ncbi:MAG: hypothetical protein Q7T20_12530 [Saprospiraceae bacterium]|nr:hypothetical protein [Saprospiraceae bacterium]